MQIVCKIFIYGQNDLINQWEWQKNKNQTQI